MTRTYDENGFVDRSHPTLPQAMPRDHIAISFNKHDGLGWYTLRAESKNDSEKMDELKVARENAERRGICVAFLDAEGNVVDRTEPCCVMRQYGCER